MSYLSAAVTQTKASSELSGVVERKVASREQASGSPSARTPTLLEARHGTGRLTRNAPNLHAHTTARSTALASLLLPATGVPSSPKRLPRASSSCATLSAAGQQCLRSSYERHRRGQSCGGTPASASPLPLAAPVRLARRPGLPHLRHLLLYTGHLQRKLGRGRRRTGQPKDCKRCECCFVRLLRRRRLCLRQHYQPHWRTTRLLHRSLGLRSLHGLPPFVQHQREPRLCRRSWSAPRRVCRSAVDGTGIAHARLRNRADEGSPNRSFLDCLQPRRSARLGYRGRLTWNSTSNTVGNSVYIVFLVIAACGSFLPLLLVDPATMVRSDGTRVIPPVHPTWKKEVVGMWQLMRKEVVLVFLLPLFFSSNFGYTWQQNSFNGALFTLRTRSLNSFLFWSCQMVGAGIFGILIDLKRFRRKSRAWVALVVLLAFHCAVWGSGYRYQKDYYRTPDGASVPRIDLRDAGYGGRAALYVFMGILDAITQNYAYWLMGAIFNQPASLARLVGVYKAIQSAGAAGAFAMDSAETAYMSELAATWAVCVAGLVFCIPVLLFRLKDHTGDELVVEVGSHDAASSTSEKKADEAEL